MQAVATAGLLLLLVYQKYKWRKVSFLSDLVLEEESIATKIFGDQEDERYWLLKETLCNSLGGLIKVWLNEKFKGLYS